MDLNCEGNKPWRHSSREEYLWIHAISISNTERKMDFVKYWNAFGGFISGNFLEPNQTAFLKLEGFGCAGVFLLWVSFWNAFEARVVF